jgi:hypothetical protein
MYSWLGIATGAESFDTSSEMPNYTFLPRLTAAILAVLLLPAGLAAPVRAQSPAATTPTFSTPAAAQGSIPAVSPPVRVETPAPLAPLPQPTPPAAATIPPAPQLQPPQVTPPPAAVIPSVPTAVMPSVPTAVVPSAPTAASVPTQQPFVAPTPILPATAAAGAAPTAVPSVTASPTLAAAGGGGGGAQAPGGPGTGLPIAGQSGPAPSAFSVQGVVFLMLLLTVIAAGSLAGAAILTRRGPGTRA